MFITENQNIAESILFLLSARETLSCMVEASSVDHKDALKNFLMNEASDYEIMHMLMHEEMPNEKYDFANEIRLFSDLKEQVLANYNILGEYMGESVQTFINEVDTVYPDFSSAVPVLEFQLATQDNILSEVFDKEGVGIQKVIDWLGATGRKAITMGKDKEAIMKLTNKGLSPQAAKKAVVVQKAHMKDLGIEPYLKGMLDKTKSVTGSIAAKVHGSEAKGLGPGAHVKSKGLGMTIVGDAKAGGGKAAGVLASIKAKAIAAAPALQKAVTSQVGMAVGGAALAALALYASVKLYKRFMSKAAKSCSGQSGSAKTACMKKYQHGAIAAQVKDLSSAMKACAKSKSPEKCKVPIQKKISNLQVKMQKMKASMAA
jgi:hypothetical protein